MRAEPGAGKRAKSGMAAAQARCHSRREAAGSRRCQRRREERHTAAGREWDRLVENGTGELKGGPVRLWRGRRGCGAAPGGGHRADTEQTQGRHGADMERTWSGHGAEIERIWSGHGAGMERIQSGHGARLVHAPGADAGARAGVPQLEIAFVVACGAGQTLILSSWHRDPTERGVDRRQSWCMRARPAGRESVEPVCILLTACACK